MTVRELINHLEQVKDLNKDVWISVDVDGGQYQTFAVTSIDDNFTDSLFIQNYSQPISRMVLDTEDL